VTQPGRKLDWKKPAFVLVGVMLLVAGATFVTGLFNHDTQLAPDHSDWLAFGEYFACFYAVVCAGLLFRWSRGPAGQRLLYSITISLGLSVLGPYLLAGNLVPLVFNRLDFPSASTRTYAALLPIGRAYATHPRRGGPAYTIQPDPLWTNLDITEADWTMLRANRIPTAGAEDDPDSLAIGRSFCARVQMAQAGKALKIVGTGSKPLPAGSVIPCPSMTPDTAYLELP
jgi:hypothetical protein